MNPLNYKIHMEPDLANFDFAGRTEIKVALHEPTRQITLNTNDLTFQRCTARQAGKAFDCRSTVASEQQEVTVHLPQEMEGVVDLAIDYTGEINDLLVGFYRSKYEHEGKGKYIAITQFEEREARRAFPCFDHPAKKATFDIEFLIDESLTAIANTPILEEMTQENGKKLIRFERTPKMSTYLLFFGIGEFEFMVDDSEAPLVRVAAAPGKTRYGDFGLQMGRKSLKFGQEYTGIDYPIGKCDHIAVQDFAFGAMENYGAIAYRENLLLVYPGVTSKTNLVDIANVIAHETAHMWFGDLVSPAEWKYLWLNESFATYFAHVITNHYYPEWHQWENFVVDSLLKGLERDAFSGTVPIELPDEQEVLIDSSSAPIIYSKGAAIIRMLAAYLGEEKLKRGINTFLNQYKFNSASSQDYWRAFEQATGEPVERFAESWIYQPGYPIVAAEIARDKLVLKQQRFTFSANESNPLWMIPISVDFYSDDGRVERRDALLEERSTTMAIPPGAVAFKLNGGQTGFYRVEYKQTMLDRLGQMIQEKKLSATDSFGVESDLFARVRRGDYALTDYLDFIERHFAQEERYLPLFDITANLMLIYLLAERRRERVSHIGRSLLEHALQAIGLAPKRNEAVQTSQLRETLLWPASVFGSEIVREFGIDQFEALVDGDSIHADVLSGVMKIGAATNDRAPDYFLEKLTSAHTPETEKLSVLNALGCLQEEENLRKALEWNLEIVSKKNRSYLLESVAHNPVATDFLWSWFLDHFEDLTQLHPTHLGYVIVSLIPICGIDKENEVKAFLGQFVEEREAAKGVVDLTLEKLTFYARMKRA